MWLIMISIAKVGIFFELCKSVFLIGKVQKSRNSFVYRTLYHLGLIVIYYRLLQISKQLSIRRLRYSCTSERLRAVHIS